MEPLMQSIQFTELAHLYGEHAQVVNATFKAFEQSVDDFLDKLRGAATSILGKDVQEKTTGYPGTRYRYWAIDSFEMPHIWFWATDPAIVRPGYLRLYGWAGRNPTPAVLTKVAAIANRPELGPLSETSVPSALFEMRLECREGLEIEPLAQKIADLLQALRDAG
jgi:hypothetical protein